MKEICTLITYLEAGLAPIRMRAFASFRLALNLDLLFFTAIVAAPTVALYTIPKVPESNK